MKVGYLNMELMAQDTEDYAIEDREARGKKNRDKASARLQSLRPQPTTNEVGKFAFTDLIGEDWYHDPMVLKPDQDKLKFFKVLAAGVIQTVHEELNKQNEDKFTLKKTWTSQQLHEHCM